MRKQELAADRREGKMMEEEAQEGIPKCVLLDFYCQTKKCKDFCT